MPSSTLSSSIQTLAADYGGRAVLRLADCWRLEGEYGIGRREVELAALDAGVAPLRYARNLGTLGLDGQARLLRATAAIVGLGGLGGHVLEGLARSGVGQIIAIDGDSFEEHNLNRQALSTEAGLGRPKALVAVERVLAVNAAVGVTPRAERLTRENAADLLRGADLVVDCLDNLPDRLLLQECAATLGLPLVHGAIAGFLGQVMTILPGDKGLRHLYPSGAPSEKGLEMVTGTPAATPMLVAALQVQEAVKLLAGKGELLRDCLLIVDTECGQAQRMEFGEETGVRRATSWPGDRRGT
jgi:molybdopterin/thiamine biosynthesis adenylyltransferase